MKGNGRMTVSMALGDICWLRDVGMKEFGSMEKWMVESYCTIMAGNMNKFIGMGLNCLFMNDNQFTLFLKLFLIFQKSDKFPNIY